MPKFGTKNDSFGYFWARTLKNYCQFEISSFELVWLQNLVKKQKCLTLRPKLPFLGILDQKYLISVFLGKNFEKTIVIFEISTLKFVYLQSFTEKQKCLNLGPKMSDLGIFGLDLKTMLSYLKSTPSNLSNCKISRKNKNA